MLCHVQLGRSVVIRPPLWLVACHNSKLRTNVYCTVRSRYATHHIAKVGRPSCWWWHCRGGCYRALLLLLYYLLINIFVENTQLKFIQLNQSKHQWYIRLCSTDDSPVIVRLFFQLNQSQWQLHFSHGWSTEHSTVQPNNDRRKRYYCSGIVLNCWVDIHLCRLH